MSNSPPNPGQEPNATRTVDTGGGTYIEGAVDIRSGDFVNRDKITHIYQQREKPFYYANVPAMPNHFVGRGDLVQQLTQQLLAGRHPALSAEGLPGVGKTTLAVALAYHKRVLNHFSDGVLWAGLGPTPDVLGALTGWATTLGIEIDDLPTAEERAGAIKNALGLRKCLLVIDDAWQGEAAQLLRCGGPNCGHLLTTRDQALARQFAGVGQVTQVEVLDDESAWALLMQLAPEACKADPQAAKGLLQAVGNLPLAIELLGGYLAQPERSLFPELSAEALAEMASPRERLQLATQRLGGLGSPQVTLQQTITLSLAALPKWAMETFYALGAFAAKPERFARQAAMAIAETEAKTLALLVARNLLEKDEGHSLALHQTLADVARTQTQAETFAQHREYYLGQVNQDREDWQFIETIYGQVRWAWQQVERNLDTENTEGHRAHREEGGDLNAESAGDAEESGEETGLFDFVERLHIYQERRGLWQDKIAWAEHGLAVPQVVEDLSIAAFMLVILGSTYSDLGEKQKALAYYDQALSVYEQVGDEGSQATTFNHIGKVYDSLGEKQKALAYYDQALSVYEQVGDEGSQATTFNHIGIVYWSLGEREKALHYYEQALLIHSDVGNRAMEAATLSNIGLVYSELGKKQKALNYYDQALPLYLQVGDVGGQATTLSNIGLAYSDLGEKQKALDYYSQALPLSVQVGDISGQAATLNNIGIVYNSLEEKQKALHYFNQSVGILHEIGVVWYESIGRENMAIIYEELDDLESAEQQLLKALDIAEAVKHPNLEQYRAVLERIQAKRAWRSNVVGVTKSLFGWFKSLVRFGS